MGKSLDPKLYIKDLQRVAKGLGRDYFTCSEYQRSGAQYSPTTSVKMFGGWEQALKAAGLNKGDDYVAHAATIATSNRLKNKAAADLKKQLDEANRKLRIVSQIDDAHINTYRISKHRSDKTEATALALASDWHIEEDVDPKKLRVPGNMSLNAYSVEEARRRADTFFRKIVVLTDIERAAARIPTLVLGLLGDFMSGYIHDELMESNNLSPLEAANELLEILPSGIKFLLDNGRFDKIVIPCTYGNHGRTTHKPRISTGAENSYEWFVYKQLARHFAKEKRVEFVIADGIHAYVELYGINLRFSHGDSIRYGGGVGGLTIPLNKACDSWNSNTFQYAHYDFLGHWHQLHDHGRAVVNGSLIGYSPYSLSIKARYEPPQQAFCLIDGRRAVKSCFRPIWVTEK